MDVWEIGKGRWDTVICLLVVIKFFLMTPRLKGSNRFFSNLSADDIAERESEPVELPIELIWCRINDMHIALTVMPQRRSAASDLAAWDFEVDGRF